jgi:hypothetical protein
MKHSLLTVYPVFLLVFLIVLTFTCTHEGDSSNNLINTLDFPEAYVILGRSFSCGYRFYDSTQFSWDKLEDAREMADIWISDSIRYDTSYNYVDKELKLEWYLATYCPYLKGYLIPSHSYIIDLDNDIFSIDSIDMKTWGEIIIGDSLPSFLFKTREGNKYGSFDITYISQQFSHTTDTIPGVGNDTIRYFVLYNVDSIGITYHFAP